MEITDIVELDRDHELRAAGMAWSCCVGGTTLYSGSMRGLREFRDRVAKTQNMGFAPRQEPSRTKKPRRGGVEATRAGRERES